MPVKLVQVSASPRIGSTSVKPTSWNFTCFMDVVVEAVGSSGHRTLSIEDTAVSERMGFGFTATADFQVNKVDSGGGGLTQTTLFTDTALGTKQVHLILALKSDGTTLTAYWRIGGGDINRGSIGLGAISAAPNAVTFGGTNAGGSSNGTWRFYSSYLFDSTLSEVEVISQMNAMDRPIHRQTLIAWLPLQNVPGAKINLGGAGADMTLTGAVDAAVDDSPRATSWIDKYLVRFQQIATAGNTLDVASTVPVATSAIALASTDSLSVAATVPVATSAATVTSTDNLSVAATVPAPTMATTLVLTDYTVTVAAVVPVATSAVALASTDALTVAATVPAPTSAAALTSTDFLTVAGTSPVATMAATMTAGSNNVAVDATVPPPTCVAAMASTDAFAVAGVAPVATLVAALAADLVIVLASTVPVATMTTTLTVTGGPAPPVPSRPDVSGFIKRVYR